MTMARSAISLPLYLAAVVTCLSAEIVHARSSNQLYHERKQSSTSSTESKSQIETVFRRLPSIENEVDSLFDDVSFISSFEASPSTSADKKNDDEVEAVFRRILQQMPMDPHLPTQEEAQTIQSRGSSFLNNHLQSAGVFGGDGASGRSRGGVRGSGGVSGNVGGLAEAPLLYSDQVDTSAHGSIPRSNYPDPDGKIGKIGKSGKSFKGDIGGYYKKEENMDYGLKHKKFKREKRYKGKVG